MLRRPGDRYSIWVFWYGEKRQFECWYVNLEEPYRRSAIGIDTLDHELDLWSEDGVSWHLKDEEGVQQRIAEGRFGEQEAERIWADAAAFQAEYERNGPWWDLSWAEWKPPADLVTPSLPDGWELVPAA
jgi:predicted RNA-binding protein associated with RNAse of E/G family